MYKAAVKYISMFLFLAVFLVPRIADFHAFNHLSDDKDAVSCKICDILSHNQQLDLFYESSAFEKVDIYLAPSNFMVIRYYSTPYSKIVTPEFIYNKPPPVL